MSENEAKLQNLLFHQAYIHPNKCFGQIIESRLILLVTVLFFHLLDELPYKFCVVFCRILELVNQI